MTHFFTREDVHRCLARTAQQYDFNFRESEFDVLVTNLHSELVALQRKKHEAMKSETSHEERSKE